MNRSDIQTFYPITESGLNSLSKVPYNNESSFDDDASLDDSKDDQESTDFEESDLSDVGGINEADLPTYRQLVKSKKLELKAAYGKGHFDSKTKKVCTGGFTGSHQECGPDIPYPCGTLL